MLGLGSWRASTAEGQMVIQAQQDFCDSDARAQFVPTDDLSLFFHFNAASMLIIGDRVARALESLTMPEIPPTPPRIWNAVQDIRTVQSEL